jgi:GTPase SAR1 family protein
VEYIIIAERTRRGQLTYQCHPAKKGSGIIIPSAMPHNPNPTLVHRKIAVLGFRAVGKTSLTNAFVSGTFSDNYDPTIENTHHKTIRFRKVHFATDIIDTAGMVSCT